MALNQAYAEYNNSKVMTASPAELTLMLYEGAIKFTNVALIALEKNDVQKVHDNIMKTENIVMEFKATLDHKYTVAKEFDAIYDYIYNRLIYANMKKDREALEEVLDNLRMMRDTWKEVMKSGKKAN